MVEKGTVPDALTTDTDRAQHDRISAVRKCITELPERQRIALVLSRYEGLSYKEIAATMKTSVSSVESLLFRAKQTLREKLNVLKEQGRL
jgi:RNA polymerase sigma-70 factor (ECF subfamily)